MKSRALLAAVLSAVTLTGFGIELERAATAIAPTRDGGPVASNPSAIPGGTIALHPRKMVRKPGKEDFYLPSDPLSGEPWYTGNIVLKFRDEVRARAPRTDAPGVASFGGADLTPFAQILADNKLTVRQWINRTPEQLAALEGRALAASQRAQPDLAGMMIIENVDPEKLVEIAWAINTLPEIEFANIERIAELHQCGPDSPWPCNAPAPTCDGDGFNCNPDPGGDNPLFGCQDAGCCEAIAGEIPYCNDEESPNGWDIICAAFANLQCNGTIYDNVNPSLQDRYDPCFTDPNDPTQVNPIFAPIVGGLQQGCFEPHAGRGCSNPSCCFAVCNVDPGCCNAEWDQNCVNLARSPALATACVLTPDPGPTPDFTYVTGFPGANGVVGGQLYTQAGRADPEYVQVDPADPIAFPGAPAWSGRGLDLPGFEALQTQVCQIYLGGITPDLYGEGVRVAIIEFSAFVNHEEFTLGSGNTILPNPKVIQEEGQTILLIEGANNAPQHGTATLGQVVAGDNDFGLTGIAKNAQGYFFPIVSVEEGFRAQNAIVSCFEQFEAGDVVNHSWGSPPDRPLPAIAQYYTLIALGSDIGITTVVSAGNSNCPIQPQAGEDDSGVFIIGACSPGRRVTESCPGYTACIGRFLRLPFSNYTGEGDLATVHLMAWGQGVVTTGYGDAFVGANGIPANDSDPIQINQLRMYTTEFSGTSSAAPIITGSVALLQAMAKQIYNTPLAPATLRGIMTGNGEAQCPIAESVEQCGISTADCCVSGDPNCEGVFKNIGALPRMFDCGVGLFTGTEWDGNRADVEVIAGRQPQGAPWASFLIRAADGSYFRMSTVRRSAGQQAERLTYLSTGETTDMRARLTVQLDNPTTQLDNLGISCTTLASRSNVILGVFVRNFNTNRYEFLGVDFLTPIGDTFNFDLPNFGAMTNYLNADNRVEFRIWTCGLGTTKAHEVWHDLIEIRINNPFEEL